MKPILYIHSRADVGAGLSKSGVKEGLLALFGDISQVTFDENNGLVFEDFLKLGEPKVYLTDWASSLHGLAIDSMRDIFDWVKSEHPQTKVVAFSYPLARRHYETFLKEGKIDYLLRSKYVDDLITASEIPESISDIGALREFLGDRR